MTYDAVVVGAGVNGLTAAARLVAAGRSVLVVERSQTVGGNGRTDEILVDGVRHVLSVGVFVSIPKGVQREIRASSDGITYLSIHRRRSPLAIGVRPADPS